MTEDRTPAGPGAVAGATYLGGVEKKYVREACWIPLLEARKQSRGARIRYLTLPGRHLTELRPLAEKGVIEGPADLVLVEQDLLDYYAIVREVPSLAYRSPIEPFMAAQGDLNDLVTSGVLDSEFPFDAINLDYCGFFWGTGSLASRKWSAVKRIIELQGRRGVGEDASPFTLFLTIQGRGDAKEHVSGTLDEYRETVGDQWAAIEKFPYHGKLLYAVPLMIIHSGFSQGYRVECTHRYVYRPTSVLGTATMLAFAFTFEPLPKATEVTSSVRPIAEMEQEICEAILSSQPIHLIYDERTTQLQTSIFDPTGE